MNDPAPAFGRGGWVCAALLVGLFAGCGLTWAALRHRPTDVPLVVYELPPASAVPASATPAAASSPLPTMPALPPGDHEAGAREPILPPDPATPSDAILPHDVGADRTIFTLEGEPTDAERAPSLRARNDHLLRGHPRAEGCLSNALAALAALTKKGFNLRDKVWDGEISMDEGKAVSCQLFKGNEYCFCVGTDAKGAKLSLQFYDRDGSPAEADQSQQTLTEGATALGLLKCRQTGTYFVVVKLEAAAQEKVPWGMVSAYR